MFNVCVNCGLYREDKTIDWTRSVAICPECGHAHPLRLLPLFILGGASGTGKSTVTQNLTGVFTEVVVLESDILWMEEFHAPEQRPKFFNAWLRLAKNIGQSGRPVLLNGAGLGVPENLTACSERRYFRAIHYLALVCDDDELERRLIARPVWRGTRDPIFVQEQIKFNRWFKEEGPHQQPSVALLDTTALSVEEVCRQVRAWIMARLD